jgi:hypothetical protein
MVSFVTNVTSIRCSDGTSIPVPGSAGEAGTGALVQVTGTAGSLRFQEDVNLTDTSSGIAVNIKGSTTFTGSISGGAITGTLAEVFALTYDGQGLSARGNWSSSSQVTAR